MRVNAHNLELRIAKINRQLMDDKPSKSEEAKLIQRRQYYVGKLGEMDELGVSTINI